MIINPKDRHPIQIFNLLIESGYYAGGAYHRRVHFDGTYFVIKLEKFTLNTTFQIRTKGKPKHSKIKLEKINTQDDRKEYIDPNGSGYIEDKYYTLYDQLKGKYPKSKVFISGFDDEIHVAITKIDMISKIPLSKISPEQIQKVSDGIHSFIDLAVEISQAF